MVVGIYGQLAQGIESITSNADRFASWVKGGTKDAKAVVDVVCDLGSELFKSVKADMEKSSAPYIKAGKTRYNAAKQSAANTLTDLADSAANKWKQAVEWSAENTLAALSHPSMRHSPQRAMYMQKYFPEQYLAEGRETLTQVANGIGQAAKAALQYMKPVGLADPSMRHTPLRNLYVQEIYPEQYLAEGREVLMQVANGIAQAAKAAVQHTKPVGTYPQEVLENVFSGIGRVAKYADRSAASRLGDLMSRMPTVAKPLVVAPLPTTAVQVASSAALSTAMYSTASLCGLVAVGYGAFKGTCFVLDGGLQKKEFSRFFSNPLSAFQRA